MENIAKSRKAFFSFESIGVFQGEPNPLSSRSIVETCVMPILLFGSESWYLTDATLDELERFQCTIGRRILRMSRFHSNTNVLIGLDWPSMRARVLIRKLNYLRKLVGEGEEKLSSQIYHLFASKDVSKLTIVEQCHYLEAVYGTTFTGEILTSADSWRSVKARIISADKDLRFEQSRTHQSLKHLSAIHFELSWLKVWDGALDHGVQGTKAALCLFNTLSRPLFGDRLCPRCGTSVTEDLTYVEHLILDHRDLELGTVEDLQVTLVSASSHAYAIGKRLMSSLPSS